jgi:hypothetical protein
MSGPEINFYADDAEEFKHTLHPSQTVTFQDNVNKLKDWSDRWLFK